MENTAGFQIKMKSKRESEKKELKEEGRRKKKTKGKANLRMRSSQYGAYLFRPNCGFASRLTKKTWQSPPA